MLNDIAFAIAKKCAERFKLLGEAQEGIAEIKHLKAASCGRRYLPPPAAVSAPWP